MSRISLNNATKDFTLMSPNHPSAYFNLMECTWFVAAEPLHLIRARFLAFETDTDYDFLIVGFGPGPWDSIWVFDAWTGTSAPSQVISSSNVMWVHFSSNYEYAYSGFKIVFILEETTNGRY